MATRYRILSTKDIVTTVGDPGSDSSIPTEQAVREAFPVGFHLGNYTSTDWDGNAKDGADGTIDLSSAFSLPAGIKAIACRIATYDETAGVTVALGPSLANINYGIQARTQVANVVINVAGIVPCDANGDVYFYQSGEVDGVFIFITGYWI